MYSIGILIIKAKTVKMPTTLFTDSCNGCGCGLKESPFFLFFLDDVHVICLLFFQKKHKYITIINSVIPHITWIIMEIALFSCPDMKSKIRCLTKSKSSVIEFHSLGKTCVVFPSSLFFDFHSFDIMYIQDEFSSDLMAFNSLWT